MKELYPMHGIITTVITPFHSGNNKEIDWPSFRREIQTCMDAGVAGFLVPCMASEMNQLTHEEIIQEVRETVALAHTKENCIVIPSITANDEETRLRQCKEYLELGVDGLNLNMPYTTDDEYCAMVKKIDDMKPNFLCIQDVSMTDDGLPDRLLLRLFDEFESVRCAKI